MISDIKQVYETAAAPIVNWKSLNKNVLVNKYLDYKEKKDPLADAYLSAVFCRYWGLIDKYYTLYSGRISKETCYDWLVDAVMYATTHQKWRDPQNKLFTDPAGPDKVINRCMLCKKQAYFQNSNYAVRAVNFKSSSLEDLMEKAGDSVFSKSIVGTIDDDGIIDTTIQLVESEYKKKNYFTAFMIDAIANYNTFNTNPKTKAYEFSGKRLIAHMKHIGDSYAKTFSKKYNFDLSDVLEAVKQCSALSASRAYRQLRINMERLKSLKIIKEIIHVS